jgi:hypothetical protein
VPCFPGAAPAAGGFGASAAAPAAGGFGAATPAAFGAAPAASGFGTPAAGAFGAPAGGVFGAVTGGFAPTQSAVTAKRAPSGGAGASRTRSGGNQRR